MQIPHEFDDIRPFTNEEISSVIDELKTDVQFQNITKYILPNVPFEQFIQIAKSCKTLLDLQKMFSYKFLQGIISKCTDGIDMDSSAISNKGNYTFVSNHRDIVLDSGFLSALLLDNGFATTCEIAIGDNLLVYPWIEKLVRLNKAFIVRRSLSLRQQLLSSKQMSGYMHFAINEKKENIWIAQREGRAKDSNDRTQEAILKMMTLNGKNSTKDKLKDLNIVPLTITYEFDPCDYLKAAEFQLKRDNPDYKKSQQDDLDNMKTGIYGYKGKVHYHCAPCLNEWLDTLDTDMPNTELFPLVASHMDQQIHSSYQLYANNYIAADMLERTNRYESYYSVEQKERFTNYLASQIEKINIPNPDVDFLRDKMLLMYANPLYNKLKVKQS